ncbi:uncharacterized protein LOC131946027 [Physella acuta]|uniref:uncharacterized protein LOC131946027 n=1 Tax=Physella acuta TaxID=109671 RepID=UPI0027DD7971|nr:uncharacterized protein LOC131946027 [Physella acuta]
MSALAYDPVADENNPGTTVASSRKERHSKYENRSIQFQEFSNCGADVARNDPDPEMAEKDLDLMLYTVPRRSDSAYSDHSFFSSHTPRLQKPARANNSALRSSIASRARPLKEHEQQGSTFLSVDMMPNANRKLNLENQVQATPNMAPSRNCPPTPGCESRCSSAGNRTPAFSRFSAGQLRVSSASSYTSPVLKPPKPNPKVKMPFKQSRFKPEKTHAPVSSSRQLAESTAMATHVMNKILKEHKLPKVNYVRGRLLKARMKSLEPVAITGPSIHQCRGIVAETRAYSASESRTYQRWKAILSGPPYPHGQDTPDLPESLHRTSEASTPDPEIDLPTDLNNSFEDSSPQPPGVKVDCESPPRWDVPKSTSTDPQASSAQEARADVEKRPHTSFNSQDSCPRSRLRPKTAGDELTKAVRFADVDSHLTAHGDSHLTAHGDSHLTAHADSHLTSLKVVNNKLKKENGKKGKSSCRPASSAGQHRDDGDGDDGDDVGAGKEIHHLIPRDPTGQADSKGGNSHQTPKDRNNEGKTCSDNSGTQPTEFSPLCQEVTSANHAAHRGNQTPRPMSATVFYELPQDQAERQAKERGTKMADTKSKLDKRFGSHSKKTRHSSKKLDPGRDTSTQGLVEKSGDVGNHGNNMLDPGRGTSAQGLVKKAGDVGNHGNNMLDPGTDTSAQGLVKKAGDVDNSEPCGSAADQSDSLVEREDSKNSTIPHLPPRGKVGKSSRRSGRKMPRPFSSSVYSDRVVYDTRSRDHRPASGQVFAHRDLRPASGHLFAHRDLRPASGHLFAHRDLRPASGHLFAHRDLRPASGQVFAERNQIKSRLGLTLTSKSRPSSAPNPSHVTSHQSYKHPKQTAGQTGKSKRSKSGKKVRSASKCQEDKMEASRERSVGGPGQVDLRDRELYEADLMWDQLPSDHSDDDLDLARADPHLSKFDLLEQEILQVRTDLKTETFKLQVDLKSLEQDPDLDPHTELPSKQNLTSKPKQRTQSAGGKLSTKTHQVVSLGESSPLESENLMPIYPTQAQFQRKELSLSTMISSALYQQTNLYVPVKPDRRRKSAASTPAKVTCSAGGTRKDCRQVETEVTTWGQSAPCVGDRLTRKDCKQVETEVTTWGQSAPCVGDKLEVTRDLNPRSYADHVDTEAQQKLEDEKKFLEKQVTLIQQQLEKDYPFLTCLQKKQVELSQRDLPKKDSGSVRRQRVNLDVLRQTESDQNLLEAYRQHCMESSDDEGTDEAGCDDDGDDDNEVQPAAARPWSGTTTDSGLESDNHVEEDGCHVNPMTQTVQPAPVTAVTEQNMSDRNLLPDDPGDRPLEVVAQAKKLFKPRLAAGSKVDMAALCAVPPLCFKLNARPPDGCLFFFAYDHHMSPDRISTYLGCQRSPERFWALLFGFGLVFNRKAASGDADVGGFPNLEYNPSCSVEGCIYKLTSDQLQCLDKFMGYPQHMEHVVLPVWMSNCLDPEHLGVAQHCVPAVVYIAHDSSTWQEPIKANDYVLTQCHKVADLLTPSYRDYLRSFTSTSSSTSAVVSAMTPCATTATMTPCSVTSVISV